MKKADLMRLYRNEKRPYVIAHRGASVYEPENTLGAFDLAETMGADFIEFDVHLSKDNVPVVIHDWTVDRTTDGHGVVAEMTLDQLKELNAAARFKGHSVERIPTLREVLERYSDKVYFDLEIKNGSRNYKGIEDAVVSMLRTYSLIDRCEVESSDLDAVKRVRKLERKIATGIIFERGVRTSRLIDLAKRVGCKVLDPSAPVSREEVVQVHKAKLAMNTWTVNQPANIRYVAEKLRIDGLCTACPDKAVKVLDSLDVLECT